MGGGRGPKRRVNLVMSIRLLVVVVLVLLVIDMVPPDF